ncbi:hypothetical protein SC020_14950 [Legionella pneumophila serogroup 1]|uniref:hypothetical protein n=1 Tax=Legionella pneumophila TaxID=446 RepID=UPI0012B6A8B0|nr:hypothetical protein [Legionella pneumophila]
MLRRYAPRNDGPKNRTVQRLFPANFLFKIRSLWTCGYSMHSTINIINITSSV